MTTFPELLNQLGDVMGTTFAPDEHGHCAIELEEGPEVRLDPTDGQLYIGMTIGTVAPGPGRANFFKAMLIANSRPFPRFGSFSYAKTIDQIVLSETLPMDELNGEKLAGWLLALAEQGTKWQEAIKAGRIPS